MDNSDTYYLIAKVRRWWWSLCGRQPVSDMLSAPMRSIDRAFQEWTRGGDGACTSDFEYRALPRFAISRNQDHKRLASRLAEAAASFSTKGTTSRLLRRRDY